MKINRSDVHLFCVNKFITAIGKGLVLYVHTEIYVCAKCVKDWHWKMGTKNGDHIFIPCLVVYVTYLKF